MCFFAIIVVLFVVGNSDVSWAHKCVSGNTIVRDDVPRNSPLITYMNVGCNEIFECFES